MCTRRRYAAKGATPSALPWTIHQRQGRRGAFWQGRFGSVPLEERRLHICFRDVELNPVRARLAGRPEGWSWSSARAHLGLAADPLTDPAPARERVDDWRAFLDDGLDADDDAALRAAERTGRFPSDFPSVPGT